MDAAFLIPVLLLLIRFRYHTCTESYWGESFSLRNYHPDPSTDFNITINSTLFACMSLCLMTEGCCFISYIVSISLCEPRQKMMGFHHRNSSSVWTILEDDGCPCGWHKFETSCFLIPNVKLSWQDSATYCGALKARLVELDTEPKNTFVRRVLTNRTDVKRAWAGGSDIEEEDKWIWTSSGSSISNFTNWCKEQPNNKGGNDNDDADCLCFLTSNTLACWYDGSCFRTGHPICEKPAINWN